MSMMSWSYNLYNLILNVFVWAQEGIREVGDLQALLYLRLTSSLSLILSLSLSLLTLSLSLSLSGVREVGDLQAGQAAVWRGPGSRRLLHHPLCGHIREDRHEDRHIRDPAPGGEHQSVLLTNSEKLWWCVIVECQNERGHCWYFNNWISSFLESNCISKWCCSNVRTGWLWVQAPTLSPFP